MRILVVEDEQKIARFVELELTHEGYEVTKAFDGRTGIELALGEDFDLILLDLMIPELSGMEVLRRLRRMKQTPVIVLTARDAVMDKVAGLDAGANDYMTKPFAIEELLARIRVALKQAHPACSQAAPAMPAQGAGTDGASVAAGGGGADGAWGAATMGDEWASAGARPDGPSKLDRNPGCLQCGSVVMDVAGHTLEVGGVGVELTAREFDILRVLMEHKGIVMTREQLLKQACGFDFVGESNAVDVYVRHIRAKVDDVFGVKLVSTVRGVGYVVREDA